MSGSGSGSGRRALCRWSRWARGLVGLVLVARPLFQTSIGQERPFNAVRWTLILLLLHLGYVWALSCIALALVPP